jgi:NADP-dependent 3-hydroxy acid dehydrogenase YdfG
MDLGISNKKAIVCASTRGLGKACAESLAMEGVEIFINGIQEENLKKTEKEFLNKGYKVTCNFRANGRFNNKRSFIKSLSRTRYSYQQ